MTHPLLQSCLSALAQTRTEEDARLALESVARDLLRRPENGFDLAFSIGINEEPNDKAPELIALEYLMTEARMNIENQNAQGAPFLQAIEDAILRLSSEHHITFKGTVALGRCYVRADLPVPNSLQARHSEPDAIIGSENLPDLGDLLETLRKEVGTDGYMLHGMLEEMLATVQPEAKGALVSEVAQRDDPLCNQLACYWLLDDSKDVRLGAAAAILNRAQIRAMDAAMVSRILEIRAWQPEDDARSLLDQAIKEALRQELSGGIEPKPWTVHRILGSIPDGAGAQSIAIAAQNGGQRGVIMILLKQNFGIKDAYVVPCGSASEQRRMLDHMLDEIDMLDLTPAVFRPTLAAALAEGMAVKTIPPHALIDIVEILGLTNLRPEPMCAQEWASYLDPDGMFANLSPQKLGRLVNESADWPENYPIVGSWYEDSEDVQNIMTSAITPRTRETALWKHLETRRDWWAEILAKTAFALKAESDRSTNKWISFMVTALALKQDRPLRKVPIMRWIVEGSLDQVDNPWARLSSMSLDDFSESEELPVLPLEYSPPAPEKKGELERLLNSASMAVTPHWLEGYLVAIVLAPNLMSPSDWIGNLLDLEHNFKNEKQMQRFLDLILHRYNAANVDLVDTGTMKARIAKLTELEGMDWASGFSKSVAHHPDSWSARSTNKDDKAILKAIASASKHVGEIQSLSAVLSAWFTRRYKLRQ